MPQDNVLSLNAFGEIIDSKKKREYSPSPMPDPDSPQQIIPLTRVTPQENPEVISPDEEPGDREDSMEAKQSNQVASKVLLHMAQTKLLHWQTRSLAEHEALDKLFESLVDLGDQLVETVMGKYGRPHLSEGESDLKLANYESPESPDGLPRFLKELDSCFRKECTSLFSEKEDPEIHNLIQEILGKIDQIAYLLTLRK